MVKFKIIEENEISPIGYLNLKESLLKNKFLKKLHLHENYEFDKTNILNNEFHLVYKLIKLSENDKILDLDFSNNIYFLSKDIHLKLNYLKCFIDEIDHLFFNFHHFDIIFLFNFNFLNQSIYSSQTKKRKFFND
jgi:hypothetical protein